MSYKKRNNKRYFKKGKTIEFGTIFTKFNGFETLCSVIPGGVFKKNKRAVHNKTNKFKI